MTKYNIGDQDRFIRQFSIGPEYLDNLPGWQFVDISETLKLSAHPELNIEKVDAGEKSVVLIGYLLDPENTALSNSEILRQLLEQSRNINHLKELTCKLAGRWALLVDIQNEKEVFNDALGLRQVYHTVPGCSFGQWVVSQPGILSNRFDLTVSSKAESFIDSHEFRSNREYRWPGYSSAFSELRHLLPNHCLDLNTFKVKRFWPNRPLEPISLEEGVETVSRLLKGVISAAHERYDVMYCMTAGIDSRIVLAASCEHKDKVKAMTVRQGVMKDDHQDLVVPRDMLNKLGIEYTVVKAMPYMSPEHSSLIKNNVFMAHDQYGPDAEAILNTFHRKKLAISGSGAEVMRDSYEKNIDRGKSTISVIDLAKLQKYGTNEFAVHELEEWMSGLGDTHGVHLLDLYSWEQSHGNWLATTQLEFDYAWNDILTPFNCRQTLIAGLSVDVKYRGSIHYPMFTMLVDKLWPELLQYSVNPDDSGKLPALRKAFLIRKIKRPIKKLLRRN